MVEVYSIKQVEAAAGVSRRQIDAWVSRGHIRLSDNPPNGEARNFTFLDAVGIAALAATVHLGIPPSRFWGAVWTLPGYLDAGGPGYLVIWHGPSDKRWVPIVPPVQAEICRRIDLASKLDDPGKRAAVVVDLDRLEARLKVDLGAPREGEIRAPAPSTALLPDATTDSQAVYARLNARKPGPA